MLVAVGFTGKAQIWQKKNAGIKTTVNKVDIEIESINRKDN